MHLDELSSLIWAMYYLYCKLNQHENDIEIITTRIISFVYLLPFIMEGFNAIWWSLVLMSQTNDTCTTSEERSRPATKMNMQNV
jgi:EamA domain-containing membrane protein RarD